MSLGAFSSEYGANGGFANANLASRGDTAKGASQALLALGAWAWVCCGLPEQPRTACSSAQTSGDGGGNGVRPQLLTVQRGVAGFAAARAKTAEGRAYSKALRAHRREAAPSGLGDICAVLVTRTKSPGSRKALGSRTAWAPPCRTSLAVRRLQHSAEGSRRERDSHRYTFLF